MNKLKLIVGEQVKIVPQHWLRGGEIGRLVRFEQRGQNNWLVKFEDSYPGGGIDGNQLWFDPREFVAIAESDEIPETDRYAGEQRTDTFAAPRTA
jgi:hypothetical protein